MHGYWKNKKTKNKFCDDVNFFIDSFTDKITFEFKLDCLYSDLLKILIELLKEL